MLAEGTPMVKTAHPGQIVIMEDEEISQRGERKIGCSTSLSPSSAASSSSRPRPPPQFAR